MTADLLSFPTPPEREPPKRPTDPQALDWRARIEALPEDKDPCPGHRHGEWTRVRATALQTLDQFGDELVRLGWTTGALVAVHPVMSTIRLDQCGALVIGAQPVTAVLADHLKHGPLPFYRDTPGKVFGMPIWEYRWPEKAPKPPEGWR